MAATSNWASFRSGGGSTTTTTTTTVVQQGPASIGIQIDFLHLNLDYYKAAESHQEQHHELPTANGLLASKLHPWQLEGRSRLRKNISDD